MQILLVNNRAKIVHTHDRDCLSNSGELVSEKYVCCLGDIFVTLMTYPRVGCYLADGEMESWQLEVILRTY